MNLGRKIRRIDDPSVRNWLDPSILDRVSAVYAEHPVLIKGLGAAALTIAMKKIAEQHAS
jgi:hypothetical protein